MYKNVLNQYTLGIILSFSLSFDSNAQITGPNPATCANADQRSDHPPAGKIAKQSTETDITLKPVRWLWGYFFDNCFDA